MDIFDEVGMDRLRQKSEQLTAYLEFLIKEKTHGCVRIITPADPTQRGCQLSLVVPSNGKSVYKSLAERGVVCDWREPDVIRVAPVPLYNTFQDAYRFVEILEGLVA
jgi:kynureninase